MGTTFMRPLSDLEFTGLGYAANCNTRPTGGNILWWWVPFQLDLA